MMQVSSYDYYKFRILFTANQFENCNIADKNIYQIRDIPSKFT